MLTTINTVNSVRIGSYKLIQVHYVDNSPIVLLTFYKRKPPTLANTRFDVDKAMIIDELRSISPAKLDELKIEGSNNLVYGNPDRETISKQIQSIVISILGK